MILKARADEAKATIQAIAFAQERYMQEIGKYYTDHQADILNEEDIYENLKVDLSISNNFVYSIQEGDNNQDISYTVRATLRHSDWDECQGGDASSTICKQEGSQDRDNWVSSYNDTIEEDHHYLEFSYPELLEGDYIEEGIDYEHLYE